MNKQFILAGRAIFTVANPQGERYTYKVTKKEPEPGSRWTEPTFFVSLLSGPDNERDYTYVGILKVNEARVMLTKASRFNDSSQPVRVANWITKLLLTGGKIPEGYYLGHEGKCGRCGRTLTVPESIESGFGPECANRV